MSISKFGILYQDVRHLNWRNWKGKSNSLRARQPKGLNRRCFILAILEMFVVNILYIHSIVYVLLDPCLTTHQITEWQRSVSYSDKLERQIKFFKSKTTKGSKQEMFVSYLLISILDMLCHI
jgi:hypothetical protein